MDINELKIHKLANRSNTLYKWLRKRIAGGKIEGYFIQNDMKSIAVYGYNDLSKLLFQELEGTEIEIKYLIDRNEKLVVKDRVVVPLSSNQFPEVDVIVIGVVEEFEFIEEALLEKTDILIVSLEEVVG